MTGLIVGGIAIALLVGALLYFVAKSNNALNPKKWFVAGFSAVILATGIAAFVKRRKERR